MNIMPILLKKAVEINILARSVTQLTTPKREIALGMKGLWDMMLSKGKHFF